MSELINKQLCTHHLNGICKYEHSCTKVHTDYSPLLISSIKEKGTSVCAFFPNCVYSQGDCKKLHVNPRNSGDMHELISYYYKIVDMAITETNKEKLEQISDVRTLINQTTIILKDTYDCLKSM